MAVSKTKEIATVESYALTEVAEGGDLQEIIADNLGGEQITPFDLDRVTVPAGGALSWEVPTLDGEESVKEIEGIVIYWRTARAYWEQGLDESGGGSPPDCSSDDGQIGIGTIAATVQGGQCSACPMNQFGSAGSVSLRQEPFFGSAGSMPNWSGSVRPVSRVFSSVPWHLLFAYTLMVG